MIVIGTMFDTDGRMDCFLCVRSAIFEFVLCVLTFFEVINVMCDG